MFCQEKSLTASSHFGEVAQAIRCRSWTCPNCAEYRQRKLQAQCRNGNPNRFIVLTCRRGQFANPNEAARRIAEAWRVVVRKWRRLAKWHKCEYIAVFEPHVSGWPHLHILWRGHWIKQQWLSEMMAELINSPVVHVSLIKGAKSAAYYVAKYLSKAPTRYGNCKRYWTSGNYAKSHPTDVPKVFRKEFNPTIVNKPLNEIIHDWHHRNKQVWQQGPYLYGWGALWRPPEYTPLKDRPKVRYRHGLARFHSDRGWGLPATENLRGDDVA